MKRSTLRKSFLGFGGACLATAVLLLTYLSPSETAANPLSGFTRVEAGGYTTCGITTGGALKCWGNNEVGNLTDGGACGTYCLNPVDSAYFTSGVLDVALGEAHTCVLVSGGAVKCLGDNAAGELGDGGACGPLCTAPTGVTGLSSGVLSIAAGGDHSCAVLTGGSVTCWGSGQPPATVAGISAASNVAVGLSHACARTSSGGAKCWGMNTFGQLGNGTTTDSASAVDVTGMTSGVANVSAGSGSSCATTTGGAARCWGDNSSGEIGNGTTTSSTVPVPVTGLGSGVATVDASSEFACALLASGAVKCWGANGYAHLGDGTFVDRLTPADVVGIASGAVQLAASQSAFPSHACARLAGGSIKCWGSNTYGQAGDGRACGFSCPVPGTVSSSKPGPTPTPCPPSGCPTPAPQLDFSIGIDTDGNGTDNCATRPSMPTSCALPPGAQFGVKFYLHGLPPGVTEYTGYDAYVAITGVVRTGLVDFAPWPDCVVNVTAGFLVGAFAWGCAVGPLANQSPYIGHMSTAQFTCSAPGTVSLRHNVGESQLVVGFFPISQYYETPGTPETLSISCNAPPQPTPTPNAVGGIATDLQADRTSALPGRMSLLVASVVLIATAFTGLWLQAKRRRSTPSL